MVCSGPNLFAYHKIGPFGLWISTTPQENFKARSSPTGEKLSELDACRRTSLHPLFTFALG